MKAAAPPDEGRGAAAFPWDEAMTLGLGRLALPPAAFWALTPRELAFAIRPFGTAIAAPPTRAGLADLMARFPDETR